MKDIDNQAAKISIEEQQVKSAIASPHNLLVVGKLLKISINGLTSRVTLGYEVPQGGILPSCTLSLTTPLLKRLADAIYESIDAEKLNIAKEIKNFEKEISK